MSYSSPGFRFFKLVMLCALFLLQTTTAESDPNGAVFLYSTFSWGGVRGNVTFSWTGHGTPVTVEVSAELTGDPLLNESPEYNWAIHEHPVSYNTEDRCTGPRIGKKVWDLSELLGKLTIPMNSSQVFVTDKLAIIGNNSIWGHSIRIKGERTTCSNIQGVGGEKIYEARFHYPVGGSVWFRTWSWDLSVMLGQNVNTNETTQNGNQVSILTEIYDTKQDTHVAYTNDWLLYITDILDDRDYGTSCNFLTRLYDPKGKEFCDEEGCPQGNLTRVHGQINIQKVNARNLKNTYTSTELFLPDLNGPRKIYLAIQDDDFRKNVYACAQLRQLKPKQASANFNSDGVTGKIYFEQVSPFSPTEMVLDLQGLNNNAGGFHVHVLPTGPPRKPGEQHCGNTQGHFNPYGFDKSKSMLPGYGTHDNYEVGDLSGKHGLLTNIEESYASVTDHNLPLYGQNSIIGRSIVIHRQIGSRWVCANIRPTVPLIRAAVVFRYPLVGEIIFEQEQDDPLADTTILIGPLVYSDGSHNDTNEHDWHIHVNIPDKDYYDWQNRCLSAGPHYNPYKISLKQPVYNFCSYEKSERCEVADLVKRHGPLKVSGTTQMSDRTRVLLTDRNLPLSGPHTILGHSIVIHDKHAPKHRGNRLSCTGIHRRFRHKGVVSEWHAAKGEGNLEGKIEFIQETEYDITNTKVDIRGLQQLARGYHVHVAPVEFEKEYPCVGSITYGHYNPLNFTPSESPPPDQGTDDLYELGDLSGKYGTLEGKKWMRSDYNDTSLPLWGSTSIMGRSVVVHKKEKNERWFCGNIGWGYSPAEARQVAAIASFHHPTGYAWGYIRMRQLVYLDGALGETYIEVNLRHPGKYDKNVTRGHNWSVYVNPVGVDAGVKFFQSRCVAGGFRWNPYLVHLAFPNNKEFYDKECTPEFPLRCDSGDISGRLGPIDLGDKKYVFVDKNLPLAGEHSALGKSIIIHNENGKVERFACANIEPDHDIIKWTNLKRTPKFSAQKFINEVREILNCPEWFISVDLQTVTNSADERCVTFRLRFMGPLAKKLEHDFSRLLAIGSLDKPSIVPHGVHPDPKRKKEIGYQTCGSIVDEYDVDVLGPNADDDSWWGYISDSTSNFGSSSCSRNLINIYTVILCFSIIFIHI